VSSDQPAADSGSAISGEVSLQVPASSAFISVLRSVTAGLAARCDLTLDEIEDLRIAVDEACALLLPLAAADEPLSTSFRLAPGELHVTTAVIARPDAELRRDGFGWTVLEALVSTVETGKSGGALIITLTKRRDPTAQ
jgi:serine/threonine-protein kinase RsbW